MSGRLLDPSLDTSRKGLQIISTFYPLNLKTLGVIFLLQFQVTKVLGMVKNYNIFGNGSCIVFLPIFEFSSCSWAYPQDVAGERKRKKKTTKRQVRWKVKEIAEFRTS